MFKIIQLSSSIEFILLAPIRGRDVIVISSRECTTELLGYAKSSSYEFRLNLDDVYIDIDDVFTKLESHPVSDVDKAIDYRTASYIIVWRNPSNEHAKKYLSDSFNGCIHELHKHMMASYDAKTELDAKKVEEILSPFLLRCFLLKNSRQHVGIDSGRLAFHREILRALSFLSIMLPFLLATIVVFYLVRDYFLRR